jgi:[ribosomal protein S5]-alanine N-acetyltransferase
MQPKSNKDNIIGSIGFTQIFRGPFCSCVLGYQIDHAAEGKGLMLEALRAAIDYMFTTQKLHRIGANYRPENVRSGRLLSRLGFRIDGFAKEYLFIDGAWRDHVLTSLTNEIYNPTWLVPNVEKSK